MDNWDDEEMSGFTPSKGAGQGGEGGWKESDSGCSDEKRGRKSGGSDCYKCGESGHFARECPNADATGGGGGKKSGGGECYKCGECGHFARECPNADATGGGGKKSGGGECYKCGESGHFARECPNADATDGGGKKSGGGECYKCGESGHFARECPKSGESETSRGKSGACYKCGEEGHMARDCPKASETTAENGDRPRPPPYVPPPPSEEEEEIFQTTIAKGINFEKYDTIPVEATGSDVPRNITSFEEASLNMAVKENITKAKYVKPTPVQKHAIPAVLKGRDLMACAQTGSGKTAAFLLPVISRILDDGVLSSSMDPVQSPQALCIAPTRELAVQIFMEARKFSHGTIMKPAVVYGGTSIGHQLRNLEKGCDLLVATPGRLKDFVARQKVSLSKVKYLILDEADRMLDMGFEPHIRELVESMAMPSKKDRQTLMFSATFPGEIQTLARDFLENYIFLTVGTVGGTCSDVEQKVLAIGQFEKRDALVGIVEKSGSDRVLVFVDTKRNCDFLAIFLSQNGFPATSIHGDRFQSEREEALRDFKSGRYPILCATAVAARGLDIPNVSHVVNYDLPSDISEYVHRVGRTGRIGNQGLATSFFDSVRDSQLARSLAKILSDSRQEVPDFLEDSAESALGSSYGQKGGKFGSRDVRSRQQSNGDSRTGGGSEWSQTFGASSVAAVVEESWD